MNPEDLEAQLEQLMEDLRRSGQDVALSVTIAADSERISPNEAGQRLGFSRQHVMRLIEAGELDAGRLEGSSYWRVPVSSVVAFEERRERAAAEFDGWSRALDEAGAPLE